MNSANLIGRLTRDPEERNKPDLAIVNFTIAIDRPKASGEKETDFPRIVCFGKTAEFAAKYLRKGARVGVSGHIQTGSYDRDGVKVYTTDVVADRLTVIDWPEERETAPQPSTWGTPRGHSITPAPEVDPFDLGGEFPF